MAQDVVDAYTSIELHDTPNKIIGIGPATHKRSSAISRLLLVQSPDGKLSICQQTLRRLPHNNREMFECCRSAVETGCHGSVFYSSDVNGCASVFAKQLFDQARDEYGTLLDTLSKTPKIVPDAFTKFLGWCESHPDQTTLQARAKRAWINACAVRILRHLGTTETVWSILCVTVLFEYSSKASLLSLPLPVLMLFVLLPVLFLILFTLTTLLELSNSIKDSIQSCECDNCGAFDSRELSRLGKSPRPCPYCYPLAALEVEIRHSADKQTREQLFATLPDTTSFLDDREARHLIGNSVFAHDDGTIAFGPLLNKRSSSENVRLFLRVEASGEFIVESKKKAIDSDDFKTVVNYRTCSFVEACVQFASRLGGLANINDNDVSLLYVWPNPVPIYRGWTVSPASLRDDLTLQLRHSSRGSESWTLFAMAVITPFLVIMPIDWKGLFVYLFIDWKGPLLIFLVFVFEGLRNWVCELWFRKVVREELVCRTCRLCGLIDSSPGLVGSGYARPCPICFYKAATSVHRRRSSRGE